MRSLMHLGWHWGKCFSLIVAVCIGLISVFDLTTFLTAANLISAEKRHFVSHDQEPVSLFINRIVMYFNNRGSLYPARGVAGAPIAGDGKPRLFGNQTIWMVYNGADSTADGDVFRESFARIPVEVHQLAYARAASANSQNDLFSNVVF